MPTGEVERVSREAEGEWRPQARGVFHKVEI